MIKIVIHGCGGHMGKIVAASCLEDENIQIAAGVDISKEQCDFPVYTRVSKVNEPFDAVIDFSSAKAIDQLLEDCIAGQKPLVLCTTGLSEEQIQKVNEAAEQIPVFFSANMSLGVNLITALCQKAAKILTPAGFDVEIEERHHNRKLDAPSGTALMIGNAIIDALGEEYHMVTDRDRRREKRDSKEIGVASLRAGTIVGEHTVLFAGHDEMIEIKHTALSREIFAAGSISAVKYLADKKPGLYDMKDMLGE